MGLPKLILSRRRLLAAVVVMLAAVAVAGWVWNGLSAGKGAQPNPLAGNKPAATPSTKQNNAFVDANMKLEELLKRQQAFLRQAGELPGSQHAAGAPVAGAPNKNAVAISGNAQAADGLRRQREALMTARDTAVTEIMHAGPGETQKIIAAMEKLDAQMRAAGAPSVIDMPKFRQMMIGMDRVQDISKQLTAENQKGRQADPARMQSLVNELSAAQAAMPKTAYDTAALERMMKSGH